MVRIFASSHRNHSSDKIIYHYCSLETFIQIIKNKTLRMTNIAKSNDQSEITYALMTITDATQRTLLKLKNTYKHDKHLSELLNNFDIDTFFNALLTDSNLVYYATCFSREPDLLSQWRGYANDGNGVAIGFSEPMLDCFLDAKDMSMKYAQVSYDVNRLRSQVTKFIQQRIAVVAEKGNPTLATYETALSQLLTWATYQSVFFKNPAFLEEREARLVFYPFGNIRSLRGRGGAGDYLSASRYYDRMTEHFDYSNNMHTHGNLTLSKPSFFVRGNKIVSFIDISFSAIADLFIAEIILGPKTDTDDSDIRLFLYANGYDLTHINIRKSIVPYI